MAESIEFPLDDEAAFEAVEPQAATGFTPRQHRVASLLARLAATARSFLLYDPHNETIQRFLSKLLDELTSALDEEGPLTLHVQALEITFEEAVVYVNRDRDRSLAFRLYRDGVRRLSFRPGFSPDELARLLEVLSIRYTGVNQREEDVVTLLWKARFQHLEVVSVEGIVPEDDTVGVEVGDPLAPAPGLTLPQDIDLPRPLLPPPVPPDRPQVAPAALEALRAEADPASIPDDCLRLLARLQTGLLDPDARMLFEEVDHLFGEVRDYLLDEDHLPSLKRFISLLWEMAGAEAPDWDPDRHTALFELLDSCGGRRAVRRLLHSVPFDQRKLHPALIEVLDRACPDPLAAVLDVLAVETGTAVRAVARQLVEHYGKGRLTELEERFRDSGGPMASDLLRVFSNIGGDEAPAFIARQAAHPDRAVQDEALWHLDAMPYSGAVGRALFDAFRITEPSRRARVLSRIERTGDRRFVELLAGFLAEQGAEITAGEAAQIGQLLGRLEGDAGLERWASWLTPVGFLRKGLPGSPAQQIAAAMALSEVKAEAAREVLEAALEAAPAGVVDWVLGALGVRERQGNPP